MIGCLKRSLISSALKRQAFYTTEAAAASPATTASSVQYPYFVSRNSRGSLPVYTDIRNAGGRCMILVRNIEGDVNALSKDIREQLFNSSETEYDLSRLQVEVVRSRHLVLHGAKPLMKNEVTEWLRAKGF